MSYTEIYRISKVKKTKLVGEIRNSFRGAMAVWNSLDKKYLPPFTKYGMPFSRTIGEEIKEIWGLVDDVRVSETEKICLLSTFDNVYVLRNDIPRLIKAMREFPHEASLPEQADIIEKLIIDRNCWAVCWNQTSVNGDIPGDRISDRYWNLFEDECLKNRSLTTTL